MLSLACMAKAHLSFFDVQPPSLGDYWGLMLSIQTPKSEAILIVSVSVTLRTRGQVTDLREYK